MVYQPHDPVAFAFTIFGGAVGFLASILLVAVLGTIGLRLAAIICGFGQLPYAQAFRVSLLANFVALILQAAAGISHIWTMQAVQYASGSYMNRGYMGGEFSLLMAFCYSPVFYLTATMLGVVIHALVYGRMLPTDKDGRPMNFRDALTLAVVAQAFTLGFVMVITTLAFVLLSMFMPIFY